MKKENVDRNQAVWLSGLKRQTQKNCSVENSSTRMCACVRIPLLSENVSNAMRQSLQLTNSVILGRQFKMTVQSKRKKNAKSSGVREVVWGWQASGLKLNKKKDTQTRHVKHECTRGLKRKSLQMDDTNRLAEKISEMQIQPYWKSTEHTEKYRRKPGRMADGLRRQTHEIPESRILVHECVRGFESHSCQKTFWTRWDTAFSRQILSHWNVMWRWQSKPKKKRIATSSVDDSRAVYKCTKQKITSRDMWNTNVRVGWNANLLKWMTKTAYQIKSLKCKFNPIEKAQIIQKNVGVNPAGWPRV